MTNEARTTMQHQPMVEAYLEELDRALVGTDPREHAETMAAIREHLADALPIDASSARVRQVLDELGSVDTIAGSVTHPDESAVADGNGIAPVALVSLACALAGAVFLVPLPFAGVSLALIALVAGVAHLRSTQRGRQLAWVGVIIATVTLLVALVFALTLLSDGADTAPRPDPVHTDR